MPISPAAAAKRAGVSRRTIMLAIEAHKIKATRNNRNHWQVDPDSLEEWMKSRDTVPDTSTDTTSDFERENIGLRVELKAAHDRLAEVQKDRDDWKNMAEKLAAKPRWWPFR